MNSSVLFAIEICTFCMCLGLVEGAPTYTTTPVGITSPDDTVAPTSKKYICDFDKWEQFKIDFHKTFANDDDEFKHLLIFCDNLHQIQHHNELFRQKKVGFKMGLNQFSDMTNLEFQRKILGAQI
ncbi:uncharacterized protein Dwil_GK27337 [Drosophila willistoni]|uniref:Cathepsin propeptide inhibitor domain-containing protein n=1 Tax=Drosophila willistoni TaxID=7260 RepID=A0A0Q9WS69_DROWI|nr:cathepsin L [Drosophila willistoni]KRF99109.1 uncharacterized protein Dwil_GK27337 [Drosophila willistoni]